MEMGQRTPLPLMKPSKDLVVTGHEKPFLSEAPVRWVGQEHKESTCMGEGQRTDGRREGLLSHRMGVGNPQRNVSGTGLGEKGVGQSAA